MTQCMELMGEDSLRYSNKIESRWVSDLSRAAVGTEFLSPYSPAPIPIPVGIPIPTAESMAAARTECLSPYPPHTHTYGDLHTQR